ncbi:MAG: N-acetylmuramoyl-L-alanine amidase [Anaerolineae bacterium]|nr:N-acetylmuramoyl-L-alanine amidase [Anaerolineae bacterium]
MARSCRVGVHGRNDAVFHEADYRAVREARIEALKMMSHTRVDVFKKLRAENPGLEFITRLYDGLNFGVHGHPHPQDFASRMIPVMNQLRPYGTKFEIHNEPNHLDRIEGWGETDEDARSFNEWFLRVYDILKSQCPWAHLGFPGLAIPHRDLEWIEICRPAVEKADWLGVHCYWQTPRGQERNHLVNAWGLRFKYYHERFPNKIIDLTEVGNSNVQNNIPFSEESHAQEFTEYLTECFNYPYLNSACWFILSSPDRTWDGFIWRGEDGRLHRVVEAVGKLQRPQLVPARGSQPVAVPAAPVLSTGAPVFTTGGSSFTPLPAPSLSPAPLTQPSFTLPPAPTLGPTTTTPASGTLVDITQLQIQNAQLQSQLQQMVDQSALFQSQLDQLRSQNAQLLNQLQQIQTPTTAGVPVTTGGSPGMGTGQPVATTPPPAGIVPPPSPALFGSAQPATPTGAFAPPSRPAPSIQNITQQLKHHPTLQYGSRPLSQIDRIVIHHTAVPPTVGAERIAQHRVDNQGWPAIGYHYFITGEGQIQQTNELTTVSYHAGDQYNPVAIGIAVAGDFTSVAPAPVQLDAGAQLIAWLIQELNLSPEAVYGYKELVVTQSPGNQWDSGAMWGVQLRQKIQDYLAGVI